MHRALGHVGITLVAFVPFVLFVEVAGCGALEDLGSPPVVVSLDGGRGEGLDASIPDAAASDAPGAIDAQAAAFSLATDVAEVTVIRGASAQVALRVVPASGSVGAVTVTVTGLPAGTTADPLVIPSGATSGYLTLRASASATETVSAALSIAGVSRAAAASPLSLPLVVRGASGTLDLTFGTNGIALVPIYQTAALGPGWEWPTPPLAALAIQPDGKIVYAGHGYLYSPTVSDTWPLILGRLNADGSPDTTFNATGQPPGTLVELPTGDADFVPSGQGAVQCLSSGDIAVGGYLSVPGYPPVMFVAEFTASGATKTAFAGTGIVSLSDNFLSTGPGGFLVQPDGKMILGGELGASGPALVRLLSSGAPDTTFESAPPDAGADAGIAFDAYPGYPNASFGPVVLLGNGDILAGLGGGSASSPLPLAIAISSATAQVDTSFGASGLLTDSSFTGVVQGAAVASDGSAILLGSTATTIELVHFVNGQLDSSFGSAGLASPAIAGGNASAGSIALSDGKIVVGATLPGPGSIGVVRYRADGGLDTSFGGTGYAGAPPADGATLVGPTEVAIDASGRIVFGTMVSVSAPSTAGAAAVQIARFWP